MAKTHWKKSAILLVSLLLVLTVSAGTTIAILVATTDSVENTFFPSKVTCELNESNGSYTVTNTGDTAVYIRVAIVTNWTKDGNVYGLTPITAGDYAVTASGWTLHNGYYYYDLPVAPGASTGTISVGVLTMPPADCIFTAEVLAEAIQSEPVTAAREAWGWPIG